MWSSNLNNSSTFEGGFLDNSRKDGQDELRSRRVQTLIPVMIKNLLSAPSVDDVKVWGIPVRMFTILGIIRHVEHTATKVSYDIEDHTGTITGLKWLEANKTEPEKVMKVDTYIRVVGLLREQNEKRHILMLRTWPMERLNELTNHITEIAFIYLKAKALANKNKNVGSSFRSGNVGNELIGEGSAYNGMTQDQFSIYKIIEAQNHTESGIERSRIKAQVPQKLLAQVDKILDYLVSEGHIYATSSDNEFKTT